MPINQEKDGDLIKLALAGEFDVIVHGCNCMCRMGKGIAKQVRDLLPEAYFVDRRTAPGDKAKLGTYTAADHVLPYFTIVNAYTQFDYRPTYKDDGTCRADYGAIQSVFESLNRRYARPRVHRESFKKKKVGIPLIGAGLAGGDWSIISEIINDTTPELDITLINFKKD